MNKLNKPKETTIPEHHPDVWNGQSSVQVPKGVITEQDNSWFDYDEQKVIPGSFPAHLEVVIVNPASGKKFEVVGQSSSGSVIVQHLDDGALCSFHLHQLKPLDYNRKVDEEKHKFVEAADNIMRAAYAECTGSVKIKGYFKIEASALFESGKFKLVEDENRSA